METENIIQPEPALIADTRESVELTKNSRGYNWKIKMKFDEIDKEQLKRLHEIEKELMMQYGNED